MPRVKRAVSHLKKRRKILSRVKGYKWSRSNLLKQAKVAALRAGAFSYRDRKTRKRNMRGLWQIRINAAARKQGLTYSKLISILKKAEIVLDRKILAELALTKASAFEQLIKTALEERK